MSKCIHLNKIFLKIAFEKFTLKGLRKKNDSLTGSEGFGETQEKFKF